MKQRRDHTQNPYYVGNRHKSKVFVEDINHLAETGLLSLPASQSLFGTRSKEQDKNFSPGITPNLLPP